MNITQHITEHTNTLKQALSDTNKEQRIELTTSLLSFFFLLPDFENTMEEYVRIQTNREELIENIKNRNVKTYQEAYDKSMEEEDPYSEDYEELDELQIFILEAFANGVSNVEIDNVLSLFTTIIDTIDYYENFSDAPLFWNKLLEQELVFQLELIQQAKQTNTCLSYFERYEKHPFNEI